MAYREITDPEEIVAFYTAKVMHYSAPTDKHTTIQSCAHQWTTKQISDMQRVRAFGYKFYVDVEE